MERPNAWKEYTEENLKLVREIGEEYRGMISRNKTEREWTNEIVRRLEEAGYISLQTAILENRVLIVVCKKCVFTFYYASFIR